VITRIKTPPAVEPVTLTEAKLHLRLATTAALAAAYTAEDDLLNALIVAARTWAEDYTHRAFITRTWEATLQSWPTGAILLPWPPFGAVSLIEIEGDTWDSDEYLVSIEGAIVPLDTWPDLSTYEDRVADPIVITYTSGFGATAATVPATVRQAILLLSGGWYGQRESILVGVAGQDAPMGVKALLDPYRWMNG